MPAASGSSLRHWAWAERLRPAENLPQSDVGLHDFGDDLVLAHELFSEVRILSLEAPNPGIVAVFEGCHAILKEALLPAVEDSWPQLELVAEV
ncbi:MAG: hypothetical protein FJ290_17975 [Planctomycetes bacterium]|nr:hypothetical protein [Planctomycetota bacterium]